MKLSSQQSAVLALLRCGAFIAEDLNSLRYTVRRGGEVLAGVNPRTIHALLSAGLVRISYTSSFGLSPWTYRVFVLS